VIRSSRIRDFLEGAKVLRDRENRAKGISLSLLREKVEKEKVYVERAQG